MAINETDLARSREIRGQHGERIRPLSGKLREREFQDRNRSRRLLPRLLLDTHVLIRWLIEARRLSRTQLRVVEATARRGEPVALSAVSLLGIAVLASGENAPLKVPLAEFFTT